MSALNMIFVKMIKNIRSYISKESKMPFELWLRRITINYIIDEFRKNKNYKTLIDLQESNYPEHMHPLEDLYTENESKEEIEKVIDQLPPGSRTVFNLYIEGFGHEEIASMLGISSGTSKTHLHRARIKLKELLTAENKKKVIFKTNYS